MLFPYSTDAPIYHWPYTTVGLIAINVLVFCFVLTNPEQALPLVLIYGDGLHPTQWFTSNFVHAGIPHLAGNMISLWAFGLIVEGKMGWYKTLALFLGIGAVQCVVEQLLMLGSPGGGSYGASAIIFGFMAISLVWAPENEIYCMFIYGFRVAQFEVKVMTMVGLMVVLQLVIVFFTGMTITSEMLHLIGAALGFAIGIVILKARWVECENWDVFSVVAGRHRMTSAERAQADAEAPEARRREEEQREALRKSAIEQIHQIIRDGRPEFAMKIHQRMSREMPGWALPESELRGLIQALHKKSLWSESVSLMAEYLAQYPDQGLRMRLKLAQILIIHEHRPAQGLKVMARIDPAALSHTQRELLVKLRAKAAQLHEQNLYEVADKDW